MKPRRKPGERKAQAKRLLETVQRGPVLHATGVHQLQAMQDAEAQVRRWLKTWVLPAVTDLIPEIEDLLNEPQPKEGTRTHVDPDQKKR